MFLQNTIDVVQLPFFLLPWLSRKHRYFHADLQWWFCLLRYKQSFYSLPIKSRSVPPYVLSPSSTCLMIALRGLVSPQMSAAVGNSNTGSNAMSVYICALHGDPQAFCDGQQLFLVIPICHCHEFLTAITIEI